MNRRNFLRTLAASAALTLGRFYGAPGAPALPTRNLVSTCYGGTFRIGEPGRLGPGPPTDCWVQYRYDDGSVERFDVTPDDRGIVTLPS